MSLQSFFLGFTNLYSTEMEMDAIWLEKPLQTKTERTLRIAHGHLVAVRDGQLVDCDGEPTHKVIGCFGTITSSRLSFVLWDLKELQPYTLRLK